METVIEPQESVAPPDISGVAPRPNLDPSDSLTLVPRLLAGFFLGGLAVMYAVAQNWGMVAFLAVASALMLYWGYRLIAKMRGENPEYIAYLAAEEAAKRMQKTGGI